MPKKGIDAAAAREALAAALRAPSAHNAQPWRLTSLGENRYLLWYAFADRLLADPDDRDGIMAMGGFFETLRLTAQARGLDAGIELAPAAHPRGIDIGSVTLSALGGAPDELAESIERRQCNRHPYSPLPLPPGLTRELETLGNILLSPLAVAPLVARASVMAWRDRRFIDDLKEWTRFDDVSPDGMTVDCLRLSGTDQAALKLALRMGSLPAPMARVYAERDVRLTRDSSVMAVLTAPDRSPESLFDCGRRLIRSWTMVNHLGYAWHPMSIVIDQPTVAELSAAIDGRDPVAIYRVGHTREMAAWSKRRDLGAVLS